MKEKNRKMELSEDVRKTLEGNIKILYDGVINGYKISDSNNQNPYLWDNDFEIQLNNLRNKPKQTFSTQFHKNILKLFSENYKLNPWSNVKEIELLNEYMTQKMELWIAEQPFSNNPSPILRTGGSFITIYELGKKFCEKYEKDIQEGIEIKTNNEVSIAENILNSTWKSLSGLDIEAKRTDISYKESKKKLAIYQNRLENIKANVSLIEEWSLLWDMSKNSYHNAVYILGFPTEYDKNF